jgi:two-component system NtrC family sensor kinase
VLLVDDDKGVLVALERTLRRAGVQTRCENSGQAALEALAQFAPDVIISDYAMPELDGVELLTRVKGLLPHTQRILLTGQAEQGAIEKAISRSEVFRLIFKPWDDTQLRLTVQSALEHRALAVEVERLHQLTQDRNVELEERVQQRTEALSAAKRDWELTFDTIESPIVVVRLEDRVVRRANRAAAKVNDFPVRALNTGITCHQLLFGRATPCAGCPVGPRLQATSTLEVEHGERTFVMRTRPMEGTEVAVCHARDVSEERFMGRRMLESEKMSVIGNLAGGVAHEINNPLSGILGFSQIMLRQPDRSEGDKEALQVIEEGAQRCKRIVGSLLKLSRRSKAEDRRLFDLSKCVDDTVRLFRSEAKRHPRVKLSTKFDVELPDVFGDSSQLGQVVLNLLNNALYALPNGEGELDVQTGRGDDGCFFTVRDTGTGIAPEHLPRIFDPHFTTKPVGEGTGLGLAIANRIIADHGGRLTVDTALGRGTTFKAVIPIAPTKGAA